MNAAEDTLHSMKLLNHHGIRKPMISYYREKEQERSDEIISRLQSGQSVALISDAGTPGIADPGSVIVQKAVRENIQIVSVPGPSALIAALSVSGLPTEHFTFHGFLPPRKIPRKKVIEDLRFEEGTLIFYEAPHRILESLRDMADTLGERNAAVVKEITKIHEDVVRGTLPDVISKVQTTTIAGEYVIILQGWQRTDKSISDEVLSELRANMKKGLGRKDAVQKIAERYGLSKKELYRKSLDGEPDETP
jgi:16S rRNA (cytidine1402-2'-O)-methyltransferase